MAKQRKIRVEFRKNRQKRTRENNLTRGYDQGDTSDTHDAAAAGERVRAKGDISRRRTIVSDQAENVSTNADDSPASLIAVDLAECLPGRVIKVHGLESIVEADDGRRLRCGVRRILKTLSIDQRHVIAAGDRVWFRPGGGDQGTIEKVENRRGTITRGYRRARHTLAANVDQILIVSAFEQPGLKLPLIDRYLISAETGDVRPIIVLNKADLAQPAQYQWVVGLYTQIGYEVLVTSIQTGQGLPRLRELLSNGCSGLSGQSGVGKSSLLNAIQPGLKLRVGEVSDWTWKGKHTTTTAELIHLDAGGYVVDTPGLRQFELWGVVPAELEGFFPEFRPYLPQCRFPDCSHTHEHDCAIKAAIRWDQIHLSRYESYLKLYYQKPLEDA